MALSEYKVLARIVTILLSLGFVAHAAAADSLGTFYNTNFAKTPLLDGDPEKSEEKPDAPQLEEETQNKLFEQYGDPAIDPPINVVENAPKPFKAMMAAMEAGDDDTAFKYAKQYVRYLRNLNERTTKVMGFTKYAMQSEGMADSSPAGVPEVFKQFQSTFQKDQAEQTPGSGQVRTLNDRAKDILARAEMEEDEVPQRTTANAAPMSAAQEATERARLRQEHRSRVPVDPSGRADVYFFFRPRDSDSGKMFPDVEELYKSIRSDPKIKFVALSPDTMSEEEINAVRTRTQATFPIKNGAAIATKLGITKTPSVVVISPGTSKGLFEEGVRSRIYLDELIKMMQGK